MLESMSKLCHPMDVIRTVVSYIGASEFPPFENNENMIEKEKIYCANLLGIIPSTLL